MLGCYGLDARFVLISGPEEIKKSVVIVKDMGSGQQEEVDLSEVIGKLSDALAPHPKNNR